MVEAFKIIHGFIPPFTEDFFLFRENAQKIWIFRIISNETKKTVL